MTAGGETDPDHRVVVASYNIHRGVGIDRRVDLDRTVRVIRALDADVIGLQEVGGHAGVDHLHHIARELGLTAIAGPTLYRAGSPYGNAILTRLPVAGRRQLDLSIGSFERRGAVEAVLDAGGRELRVITTHLGLRRRERRRQRQRLADVIQGEDRLLAVMGDLNQWWPLSGLMDSRWPGLRAARFLRTYPAWLPVLPLDRILVRPAGAVRQLEVVRTPPARIASDHLPVRAVLDLGRARG